MSTAVEQPQRVVLGTAVRSILCGHRRSAHSSALRGDSIDAPLLGMEKVVSEDSVRATLRKIDEAAGVTWLQRHLLPVTEPLLGEPWILATDVTVKPIYGHQEGAVPGYNPHKPGRPSHPYPTYFLANRRLVLDIDRALLPHPLAGDAPVSPRAPAAATATLAGACLRKFRPFGYAACTPAASPTRWLTGSTTPFRIIGSVTYDSLG